MWLYLDLVIIFFFFFFFFCTLVCCHLESINKMSNEWHNDKINNESIHLTNRLIHISIFQIEQKWTLDLDFTGLKKKKKTNQ